MKITKDKNNDYTLHIPSEMIYCHSEHGMVDSGLYQKFDICSLQKIFDDNKLGIEFINKSNDIKFDLGVFKLDIFEHGFARSCKLWIVKEPTSGIKNVFSEILRIVYNNNEYIFKISYTGSRKSLFNSDIYNFGVSVQQQVNFGRGLYIPIFAEEYWKDKGYEFEYINLSGNN